MKAMLLAAGRGERMRPLTLQRPKPLLEVGGTALLEHHIRQLAEAGFREIVINVSWLGDQILRFCGNGNRWGVDLQFSAEQEPLETAGGIVQARPLLGEGHFLVVNADIYTDYPFATLRELTPEATAAHLVLIDNPPQHPAGDFSLVAGAVQPAGEATLTFSGIGVYGAAFFDGCDPGKRPMLPLLQAAIAEGRLSGEHYRGQWEDVGTPQRLTELNQRLGASNQNPAHSAAGRSPGETHE